jgi:heme exporter protein D
MTMFGNHAGFIFAAYGLTILVVAVLFVWIVVDGRSQRRQLADLESRGVRRRSERSADGETA